jgi:hypothetical protein
MPCLPDVRGKVIICCAELREVAALPDEHNVAPGSRQRLAAAGVADFAASKGYIFTAEHAKAHVKKASAAVGQELSDSELDRLAGGSLRSRFLHFMHGPFGTDLPLELADA